MKLKDKIFFTVMVFYNRTKAGNGEQKSPKEILKLIWTNKIYFNNSPY